MASRLERTPWRSRLLQAAALAALVAVAIGAARDHARDDSATADEGIHLFSGAEYVSNGTFWMNLEHPPLTKALAGLSLRSLRLVPPAGGASREATPHNGYLRFLYQNRAPADVILQTARRPFPLLLALLIAVVWASARAHGGPWAGLLAAGLIALDPGFVGHASLVHTDVAAALTMTAALVLFLLAAQRSSPCLWIGAGAAAGVALATKFTAALLLPLSAVVALVSLLGDGTERSLRSLVRAGAGLLLAWAVALGVLAGAYAASMRSMPPARATEAVVRFLEGRGASAEEVRPYAALSRAVPPLGHWAAGLKGVALLSTRGRENVNFFRGEVSRGSFPAYFPAAFAVKSTPAFLLVLAAALVLGRRHLLAPPVLSLLLAAAALFAAAVPSCFNIGVRHLFPIYPLLAVASAVVLARVLPPRLVPAAACAAVAATGLSLASIHPLELGYFNALIGSPERGAAWFADSNVDWGQDLKRLADHLRATGMEEKTTIVAYAGLATNYYSRRCRVLDPSVPFGPGRYAVSDAMQAVGPEFLAGLEGPAAAQQLRELLAALRARGRKAGRVGASISLWDLPG